MNRARHSQILPFLNFLLWYLGSFFLSLGLLMVGILLLPSLLYRPTPLIGFGIIVGNFVLVVIVAVRCKVGFGAAIAAWAIGFGAMLLYILVLTMILQSIGAAMIVGERVAVAGCFVIGAPLLLNRWFARRRRIAAEAAATAAVFD